MYLPMTFVVVIPPNDRALFIIEQEKHNVYIVHNNVTVDLCDNRGDVDYVYIIVPHLVYT